MSPSSSRGAALAGRSCGARARPVGVERDALRVHGAPQRDVHGSPPGDRPDRARRRGGCGHRSCDVDLDQVPGEAHGQKGEYPLRAFHDRRCHVRAGGHALPHIRRPARGRRGSVRRDDVAAPWPRGGGSRRRGRSRWPAGSPAGSGSGSEDVKAESRRPRTGRFQVLRHGSAGEAAARLRQAYHAALTRHGARLKLRASSAEVAPEAPARIPRRAPRCLFAVDAQEDRALPRACVGRPLS